jgi:hypothetical protein
LAKAKVEPLWICTDVEPALAVREFTALPVAYVLPRGEADDGVRWRLDAPHNSAPPSHAARLLSFELGGHRLAVSPTREADRGLVDERWREFAELDLLEPFARVREAIEEAQKAAR